MTEDQIERKVERMVDHLDRLLLAGEMSQKNYTLAMRDLHEWAKNMRSRKTEIDDGMGGRYRPGVILSID